MLQLDTELECRLCVKKKIKMSKKKLKKKEKKSYLKVKAAVIARLKALCYWHDLF